MRTILLVIDGFGIGAMKDVLINRRQDIGVNTMQSILKNHPQGFNYLKKIGLIPFSKKTPLEYADYRIQIGMSGLGYDGADSFLGHKELIGTNLNFKKTYLEEYKDFLTSLFSRTHKVKWVKNSIMVIDDNIFVGNNIESDPGNNINVYGNLDFMSFEKILKIGQYFRSNLSCARVIVHGVNPSLTLEKVIAGSKYIVDPSTGEKKLGVSSGLMKVHNGRQKVIHLGIGDESKNTLIDRFIQNSFPVSLIGKTADLFSYKINDKKNVLNVVYTQRLLQIFTKQLHKQKKGLIFVNIQELDLAGHNEDIESAVSVLKQLDLFIPTLLSQLAQDDLFIITADHGNDPLVGHDKHTREYVPVVIISNKCPKLKIGVRSSLADIAATICHYHTFKPPAKGVSMLAS